MDVPAERRRGGGNPGAIKGTPLQVNGVIYLTAPDHVWALDARTGREIWHFAWQSKGGHPHRQPRRGDSRRLGSSSRRPTATWCR